MFDEDNYGSFDPTSNATKNTYSKKKKEKLSEEMPSTSEYIELKNVSHELSQLHTCIDLGIETTNVSNVTLGTDNEGFVLEKAEREFNATEDLIDVLENTLSENESLTDTTRKRRSTSYNANPDNKNLKQEISNDSVVLLPSTSVNRAQDVDTKPQKMRAVIVNVMKGKKTPKAILNKTWEELKGKDVSETVNQGFTEIKTTDKRSRRTKPETRIKAIKPKVKIGASGKKIEYYHCELCDYKTRSNTSFIHHQYIHNVVNKIEVYKCDDCNFTCNNHTALLSHKANHAQQHISYKCNFCDDAFNKKNLCLFHTLTHKEIPDLEEQLFCVVYNLLIDEQYYECFQCEFKQQDDSSMSLHIVGHQIETPLNPIVARFKCQRCDYYTKTEDMIAKHNLLHHSDNKKPLKRKKCAANESAATSTDSCAPGSAVNLEGKEQDETVLYSGKPVLKCDHCHFLTRNPRSLTNHTSLKHKRGYLKSKVFGEPRRRTLEELKARIRQEIGRIPQQMLRDVMNNFRDLLQECINRNGRHLSNVIFKYILT
ncbi:zinc finger Y-chromosomal protein 1-like isoform X2 [Anthonomus grandis grandis]|uniref:zinc finger Y-chromosomal protein 1-like isoform X2 n=1 Tax=Anthonomus grandis grandis TaxID=2921223 RepID=UPI002164F32F|nr:zinc finger Y-chromosomal protein 1-like isoform X2 [Anthonomus grandis grandis]